MNEVIISSDVSIQEARAVRPFTGGPRPEALIITCSDCSLDRPLSLHFHDKPVFLLRSLANDIPEYIHANGEFCEALEEAVSWWQVPQIIVCGHSDCRADRAPHHEPLQTRTGNGYSSVQIMLQRRSRAQHANRDAMHRTLQQLANLRTYPCIAEQWPERIELSAAFYLHESGLFLSCDETCGEFQMN